MNEENIITLNDEDGNEIKFEFLDLISYRQKDYVVMLPLNYDGSSDNLCEENHTCQVAPSAHRIYR